MGKRVFLTIAVMSLVSVLGSTAYAQCQRGGGGGGGGATTGGTVAASGNSLVRSGTGASGSVNSALAQAAYQMYTQQLMLQQARMQQEYALAVAKQKEEARQRRVAAIVAWRERVDQRNAQRRPNSFSMADR